MFRKESICVSQAPVLESGTSAPIPEKWMESEGRGQGDVLFGYKRMGKGRCRWLLFTIVDWLSGVYGSDIW